MKDGLFVIRLALGQTLAVAKYQSIRDILIELRPEYPGIITWTLKGLQRLASRTNKNRAAKFSNPVWSQNSAE